MSTPRLGLHHQLHIEFLSDLAEFFPSCVCCCLPKRLSLILPQINASTNSFAAEAASGRPPARPRPMSFTGICSASATAMTMPPLAVPSSLVRAMAVTPAISLNCFACSQAVLAGGAVQNQQDLLGGVGQLPRHNAADLAAARSSGSSCCAAVRQCRTRMTSHVLAPWRTEMPSNTTAAGSAPLVLADDGRTARCPAQISS